MRIKQNFMLRNIADHWIVVPLGERVVDFNGLITLNETGALLWKELENGADKESLVNILLQEYDIDLHTASKDVDEFLDSLEKGRLLEE
jgi:hypothetical protein